MNATRDRHASPLTARKLAEQVWLYGLFTILRRGLGFALTPVYTHFLNPSDYGVLEILNLGAWFATIVGACKVDAAFYRYYVAEKTPAGRQRILGASLLLIGAVSAVIVLAGLWVYPMLARQVAPGRSIPASDFWVVGVSTWLDLATLVPLAYCRITDRVAWVGVVSVGQAVISSVLGLVGVALLGMGYHGILVGNLVGSLVAALLAVIPIVRSQPEMTLAPAGLLLHYGLPMFPATLFMYVIGSADRFFLARYDGLSSVGVYAVAAKFAMAVNLIVMGSFGEMWGANQYRLHANRETALYQRTGLTYLAVLFWTTLAVGYFGRDLVALTFGSEYQDVGNLVPILTFGIALWGIVPTVDLGSLVVPGKTWIRSAATGAAAGANVGLNLLLTPHLGPVGAALATVGGFFVMALVTGALSLPLVDMRLPLGRVAAMVAVLLLATAGGFPWAGLSYLASLAVRATVLCAVAGVLWLCVLAEGEEPRQLGEGTVLAEPELR